MIASPQRGSRLLAVALIAAFALPTALAAQALAGGLPLGQPVPDAEPLWTEPADQAPFVSAFTARQLLFPRVRSAYERRADDVRRLFRDQGVAEPGELFIRVFKRERLLEVWVRDAADPEMLLLNTYAVCGTSGTLGPKRRRGDEQIPEGFYTIDVFNPTSQFHLSLGVDYPNAVDRARTTNGHPGGDIFIHGGCATVGCVPVTDAGIEELYVMAMMARDAGQKAIPVHIFPTRMDEDGFAWLQETFGPDHGEFEFWSDLRAGYLAFERARTLPEVQLYRGRYSFPRGLPAIDPR